jgi:hypothetical protein
MKWYEPDERWATFSIESREQFVEKYVVVGKFHDLVPEDVVTSFETVTYLMANSYYHWPMQDEAMSKALLIMEMAVKFKAKELNIELDRVFKNGKKQNKKLIDLIDEVCTIGQLDFLKPDFDRARALRNSKMHPDRHSYMGGIANSDNVILFINIINQLFLDKNSIQKLLEKRKEIADKLEVFKDGNFVLEYNNSRILMDIVHYHKYVKFGDNQLLMLLVNPILNNAYQYITDQKFENPIVIALKEFKIYGLTLEGVDLNDGDVKIETTYKEENMEKFLSYNEELKRVSDHNISVYNAFRSGRGLWKMEGMIYENCWL